MEHKYKIQLLPRVALPLLDIKYPVGGTLPIRSILKSQVAPAPGLPNLQSVYLKPGTEPNLIPCTSVWVSPGSTMGEYSTVYLISAKSAAWRKGDSGDQYLL